MILDEANIHATEQLHWRSLLQGTTVMEIRERHVLTFSLATQIYPSGPWDWNNDSLVTILRLSVKPGNCCWPL